MTINANEAAPRTRPARLSGPSIALDLRVNAVRPDLADAALAAVVTAPRYADAVTKFCTVPHAAIRSRPSDAAVMVSELLFGEAFEVFDLIDGWAWGQATHDRYVGWVRRDAVGAESGAATHRISVPAATIFGAPDIKSGAVAVLPLNAKIAADGHGDFVAVARGYIHHRHVCPIDQTLADPVALALGFVGTPYVWGGRTRDGIDCSGLTQAVLHAAGVACPRDTDQQRDAFSAIAANDRRRGDLVLFPGHVGLLVDAETVIHANAFWMATVVEPLADIAARIAIAGHHRTG